MLPTALHILQKLCKNLGEHSGRDCIPAGDDGEELETRYCKGKRNMMYAARARDMWGMLQEISGSSTLGAECIRVFRERRREKGQRI